MPYETMDRSLSVIFTVYNKEEYVKKSIDCLYDALSLLETPYEVIIVEDHSTDNSYSIIEPYAMRPHTTLMRNEENKGHFQTKCRGYLAAKHSWIMTVDGDDYVDKEYIKELIDAIEVNTYLLLARNNKVHRSEITDKTTYWSIHNLPFIIFRRELLMNYKEYYAAELPKSAWDDCVIITPLYCQVTDMVLNGNRSALKHYKNTNRYRVNYSHSTDEIKGIAKLTLTNGVKLMKHLSNWLVQTGYIDKFFDPLMSVLTQYIGVFSIDVRYMHPFVDEYHPRKDDSILVIYEYTDLTKELKDYKALCSQRIFIKDICFTYSFIDAFRQLYNDGTINGRPVLRISGDCNVTSGFYGVMVEKYKELKDIPFDCAGYTYKHKGRRYLDYSKPILYGSSFMDILNKSPSPVAIQEAMRIRRPDANTISLNDLYDNFVFSKSRLNYSQTYIPKIVNRLIRPMEYILKTALKGTDIKDVPNYYINDPSRTKEENDKRVEEIKAFTEQEITSILPDELNKYADNGYCLVYTYDMPIPTCIKLIGAFWQLRLDGEAIDVVTNVPCIIERPNRLKIYSRLGEPIDFIKFGGIIKRSILAGDLSKVAGDVYHAI